MISSVPTLANVHKRLTNLTIVGNDKEGVIGFDMGEPDSVYADTLLFTLHFAAVNGRGPTIFLSSDEASFYAVGTRYDPYRLAGFAVLSGETIPTGRYKIVYAQAVASEKSSHVGL